MCIFNKLDKRFKDLDREIEVLNKELAIQKAFNDKALEVLDEIFKTISDNKDYEVLEKRIFDVETDIDRFDVDLNEVKEEIHGSNEGSGRNDASSS